MNYVTHPYSVAGVGEVKIHYLEVPLLLKFNPLGGLPVSPFVLVGPQWSKVLDSEVTTSAGSITFRNNADSWDIAVVAGLGLELNVSETVGLNVQGRYAYGFRDLDGTSAVIKLRAFYALAGLSVSL